MARISKMRRFRASPSRLTKVNKTLTQAQRQRVQNEGFGALLKFACSRIPAGLASWLMSDCFDPECSHLVLSGSGRVAVTANSVSRVLGLPNSGDQVKYEFDVNAIKFINEEYGLERRLAPSNDTIMDRIWITGKLMMISLWLMIVVSTFLCPPTNLTISSKCYPALVDLSAMKNLNWCQFVVDQLKFSAREGDKKNSVRGCLYFLVVSVGVMYLRVPYGLGLPAPQRVGRVVSLAGQASKMTWRIS